MASKVSVAKAGVGLVSPMTASRTVKEVSPKSSPPKELPVIEKSEKIKMKIEKSEKDPTSAFDKIPEKRRRLSEGIKPGAVALVMNPPKIPTPKAGTTPVKAAVPAKVTCSVVLPVKAAHVPKASSSVAKTPTSPKFAPSAPRSDRNRSRSPRRDDVSDLPMLPPPRTKTDGFRLIANHFGLQGKREEMEDEHLCQDLSYHSFEHLGLHATPTRPLSLHAIFDGHTGSECAKFAGKMLPARLREKLNKFNRRGVQLTVQHLLVFTLEDLDREFMETHMGSDAGCTAAVCLIDTVQRVLYCANIGDSRAIIGRKLNHLALTRDQDGLNPAEAKRVEGSGGTIDDEGYINDTVNMTRSLGDRSGKFRTDINGFFSRNFAIVSAPEVRLVPLTDTHMFLLLACDGLFEPGVFTSSQIIQRARQLLTEQCPCIEDISPTAVKAVAKTLCKEAVEKGSTDNVSVMIVCFC